MERDFYNDDFEELLKQKTDQYKMYPSDNVWANIYTALHTRRRRFIIGMSVLITGILLLAGKELLFTGNHAYSTAAVTQKDSPLNKREHLLPKNILSEIKIPAGSEILSIPGTEENNSDDMQADQDRVTQSASLPDPHLSSPATVLSNDATNAMDPVAALGHSGQHESGNNPVLIDNLLLKQASLQTIDPAIVTMAADAAVQKVAEPVSSQTEENLNKDLKNLDWLQTNATYALKKVVKRGKYNWQAYFSPTVNFRTLSGGEDFGNPKPGVQNVPIALTHLGSPNDYVNHKPAMGYEAGGSMLYRVTRSLTLKAGLQFDYISYIINAYSSTNSQQATIALSALGYNSGSITAYSNLQNFGGNSQANLYNRYYQLSIPLGFELKVLGNDRLQFNVAANIQPTYLLNRNSYLLTTDYSDYTKAPTLFRQLNFNAGFEAFISYRIGGLRWQVGPQFRYQLLSTYTAQYPIAENIKEYGIKIGVSKTIW